LLKKKLAVLVAEGSSNVRQGYSKIYNSSRVFKPEPHDKGLNIFNSQKQKTMLGG